MPSEAPPSTTRRLLWFAAYWAGGVIALALVAGAIRLAIS